MNLRAPSLRSLISVATTASLMATSIATVVAPTIAPAVATAATNCVLEQGSTTVYPALVNAQPGFSGSVTIPQPAWSNGQNLGCDTTLVANGSGTGKTALINYYTGGSTAIDMAASSSPLSSSEAATLMAFQNGGDAMVIVVRDDNPVTQITMAQVTAIYNGNITTWQQLGTNASTKTGTLVPRARIPGSGTRDDMNRLFKMDRGTTQATAPYAKISCSSGFTTCEPNVIDSTGLARFTTSQEEGDSICASADQIAYTSLANLVLYGPGTTKCNSVSGGTGHTVKALLLQSCDYTGFSGSTDPLSLTCSGSYVAPSITTAAVGGTYPAKRALFLTLPKVSAMAAKWGTGNGTGWTDNLGLTKAEDIVNYMASTQGQTSVGAVGFIQVGTPTKQPIPDADVDLNGGIGLTDIGQITGRWNHTDTIPGSIRADVDNNGGVGLTDIGKITGQWGAVGFTAP
jgi:hypothetical protein